MEKQVAVIRADLFNLANPAARPAEFGDAAHTFIMSRCPRCCQDK